MRPLNARLLRLPVLTLAAAMTLTACQNSSRNEELAYVERPVEALYNQATAELDSRDFVKAIALFNEVERQHPYSEWARRSVLMTAYANYEARRYDDSIEVARRFLSLHPGSEGAPYAYYLIAVSYFDQIVDVGRDQGTTEYAKNALEELVRRYPESSYAKDASLKLDMVRDQLAGKEMTVGRWYLRRNQTLPAINRFQSVVKDYDTTSHTPEALHRLVEGYLTIGLRDQAQAAGAVLGYNYPDSDWYKRSYSLLTNTGLNPDNVSTERKEGFWKRLTRSGGDN